MALGLHAEAALLLTVKREVVEAIQLCPVAIRPLPLRSFEDFRRGQREALRLRVSQPRF